ncbi:carbon monoxide dehydrogenase subunit G [Polaromonas sp.]|uniref:CoxG family protein n=1 Tax=Polaromonas sp. TaxID=1869339 RepID=UPI00286AAA59|nr:carbon monoxide dehydrogenase subunit G [Polaromonas sp.]
MELQGSVTIPATPQQVWQALNNPEILRQCIPGCEEVAQISPEEMHARVLLRMGPVRARFAGKVKMTDIRPMQGYTLNFEGSGGSAGFAKGSSVITLTPSGDATQLDYTAQATVAGKLGQIGGRLIDASSKQLADKFFVNLRTVLTGDHGAPETVPTTTPANSISGRQIQVSQPFQEPSMGSETARLVWFFAGVVATSIGVWMGAHWLR